MTKRTYAQAQFLRIKARRGPMKAIIAVSATLLTAAHHIRRDGVPCHDLGRDHFVERDGDRVAANRARRSRNLGHDVDIRLAA